MGRRIVFCVFAAWLSMGCAASSVRALTPMGGDQYTLMAGESPASQVPSFQCGGQASERLECFMQHWKPSLDKTGRTGGIGVALPDGSADARVHAQTDQAGASADSRFALASMSKTVLATAAMTLVEDGPLALEQPLSTYMPELAGDVTDVGDVTLAQLASHSSGIPPEDMGSGVSCDAPQDLALHVTRLRGKQLLFAPGAVYQYSNLGYLVIAALIERVTGMRFEEAVRQRVLKPAGMSGATYEPKGAVISGRLSGGARAPERCRPRWPAGGLWASPRDFTRLLRVLLDGGGVISPEALGIMQRPRIATGTGAGDASAFGMGVTRHRGRSLLGHTGGMADFAGAWVTVPDERFGAVAMVNTEGAPGLAVLKAADVFVGFPQPDRPRDSRPRSEWGRYAGRYRDDAGALGTVDVALEDGDLVLRWVGREPSVGLPPHVTFFFGKAPDGRAEYLASGIGVARRVH